MYWFVRHRFVSEHKRTNKTLVFVFRLDATPTLSVRAKGAGLTKKVAYSCAKTKTKMKTKASGGELVIK